MLNELPTWASCLVCCSQLPLAQGILQKLEVEVIWLCLPARRGLALLPMEEAAQECSHLTFACPTLQGAVLLEISEAPGAGTSGFEKGTNSRVQVLLNNEPLEGEDPAM